MVKWVLGLIVAAALVAVGCGSDDDGGGRRPRSIGRAGHDRVVAHRQQRPDEDDLGRTRPISTWPTTRTSNIKITVLENEAFKTKLTTTMQAGKVPDIFQSWGGGTLEEQAQTPGSSRTSREPTQDWIGDLNEAGVGLYQVDGKQYGVPYNLGMVGVWYNKALFEKAGIDEPPATWDEFLADVEKLKAAGITPLAVGEKDKWPGMFWWANLSLRIAGKDAMQQAGEDGSFDSDGLRQGRRGAQAADRHAAVPGGLPGRAVGRRRRRGRDDGQRPRGDGPDGPVGAVDLRRQRQGREGARRSAGSRSRPSTAAPARPTSSSAAATASRSARTRRPRRSTS